MNGETADNKRGLGKGMAGFVWTALMLFALFGWCRFVPDLLSAMPGGATIASLFFMALTVIVLVIAWRASAAFRYKPGQGEIVRAGAWLFVVLVLLVGLVGLYKKPSATSWWDQPLSYDIPLKFQFLTRPMTFLCALLFLAVGGFAFAYFNKPKLADFFIETQSEVSRVSWSPAKEWRTAGVVVLVMVILTAFFLYGSDSALSWLMKLIGIGF